MTRFLLKGVLLAGLVGCGSGNSVTGTVQGRSLNAVEAIFVRPTASQMTVVLSDAGDNCARLKNRERLSGRTVLAMHLLVSNSESNPPLTPGTYQVSSGSEKRLMAIFEKSDPSCRSEFGINEGPRASDGTAELKGLPANGGGPVTGTFDLTFGTDRLKGHFNAVQCDYQHLNSEGGRICTE